MEALETEKLHLHEENGISNNDLKKLTGRLLNLTSVVEQLQANMDNLIYGSSSISPPRNLSDNFRDVAHAMPAMLAGVFDAPDPVDFSNDSFLYSKWQRPH